MIKIRNRITGAVLRTVPGTNLSNADLSGANLRNADLSHATGLPVAPLGADV